MKELFVKHLQVDRPVSINKAGNILEKQTISNLIDTINWNEYSYKPKIAFRIGHVGNEIWLKYYVNEKHILARETEINGSVHKDSCVEFFISPGGENYYNFEFNCIGTTHLAYGPGRGKRKYVNPQTIKNIEIKSSLGNQPFEEKTGNFEWEMMIRIPIDCFEFSDLKSFSGLKATANFYKCGDDTAKPHFVTWNPVGTENPDYHRPEYFGKIGFET